MPRDIDSAVRALRVRVFSFALAGGVIGWWAGYYLAETRGWSETASRAAELLGFLAAGAVVYGVAMAMVHGSGSFARRLYDPSGRSTPARPEYSYAQSLVARGRYDDAIAEYRRLGEASPADPEPRLRLARLLRDELGRHEEAVRCFREAREVATDARVATVAGREIVDTCSTKLGEPRRAMPELARLAHDVPDTPTGRWARGRLEELRRELRESMEL